jgi:hypothetical protein
LAAVDNSPRPISPTTARIEMILNLKNAKALGIEVSTATLLRATAVIEWEARTCDGRIYRRDWRTIRWPQLRRVVYCNVSR